MTLSAGDIIYSNDNYVSIEEDMLLELLFEEELITNIFRMEV